MAQWNGMLLTIKGRNLQAKAEAGAQLTFTKVKIGDGQLAQGQTLESLNDLISPKKILPIGSVTVANGQCTIRSNITNAGVSSGFYVREIGLFAMDPDLGEILYAVSAASAADYLPSEGGATVINNQFDIIVIVGNATSINATINPTGFVTQDQLDALAQVTIGSAVVTGLAFTSSGLTATYSAGTAYVNGVRFDVAAGSIALNPTQGQYIYLDSDSTVKKTTSLATAQAKCLLWYFSTDSSGVIAASDSRSVIDSNQFVKQAEVAANGASKIPRLDAQGKGAFSITGDAASVGGKSVGTGANQIPTRDASCRLIADQLTNFKKVKSSKDANGIFTVVEYRRIVNDTLYMKSTLSNPDARGNYQTDTRVYYKADGATVDSTVVVTITYDADGDVVSEVPSA